MTNFPAFYLEIAFCISFFFFILFFILFLLQKNKQKNESEFFLAQLNHVKLRLQEKAEEESNLQAKIELLSETLSNIQQNLAIEKTKSAQIPQLLDEKKTILEELREVRLQFFALQNKEKELSVLLSESEKNTKEKFELMQKNEAKFTEQFENLANKIFEKSNKNLDENNQKSLNSLLLPLKTQIENFKTQMNQNFHEESKNQHFLTKEIQHLQTLNQKMAQEAINLTNALKGNNKTQGFWGEIILNQVLENSGLREGFEFKIQENFKNEYGNHQKPDAIIYLPNQREIIIDAKMSLTAYEKYFNAEKFEEKESALKEHILSLKTHIKSLSKKEYHQLNALNSLDFVLLFVPLEPAFLLALENEPSLIEDGLKENIMLVSPSTLFLTLRIIHQLWRYEKQNQNAQIIAELASKIYDKTRLFCEDLLLIENSIDKAKNSFENAMKKLSRGKGNLLSQISQFEQFGIEIKKEIPIKSELESENLLEKQFENM